MKTYLVGGAVRDEILGIPCLEKDWVVVGASPEELLQQGFKKVGQHFPVFIHPTSKEEYALARAEKKVGPGYHGFSFDTSPQVTLEDDLKRRDLTINAIAKDDAGNIIDPWGGVTDCEQRTLRHISTAFAEDPVRILRTARFRAKLHALGFTIADATMQMMRGMVAAGETDHLVAERVWKEAEKTLRGPDPSQFFATLQDVGLLEKLFPELQAILKTAATAEAQCLDRHAGAQSLTTLFAILAILAQNKGQSLLPLCQRFKTAQHYLHIAKIAQKTSSYLQQAPELNAQLDAQGVMAWLSAGQAMRKEKEFTEFLQAWLLTGGDAEVVERLHKAITLLQALDYETILKQVDDKDIPATVQQAQLEALKDI